jgi:hypothetical protein
MFSGFLGLKQPKSEQNQKIKIWMKNLFLGENCCSFKFEAYFLSVQLKNMFFDNSKCGNLNNTQIGGCQIPSFGNNIVIF